MSVCPTIAFPLVSLSLAVREVVRQEFVKPHVACDRKVNVTQERNVVYRRVEPRPSACAACGQEYAHIFRVHSVGALYLVVFAEYCGKFFLLSRVERCVMLDVS